jgi:hypothetical protein
MRWHHLAPGSCGCTRTLCRSWFAHAVQCLPSFCRCRPAALAQCACAEWSLAGGGTRAHVPVCDKGARGYHSGPGPIVSFRAAVPCGTHSFHLVRAGELAHRNVGWPGERVAHPKAWYTRSGAGRVRNEWIRGTRPKWSLVGKDLVVLRTNTPRSFPGLCIWPRCCIQRPCSSAQYLE